MNDLPINRTPKIHSVTKGIVKECKGIMVPCDRYSVSYQSPHSKRGVLRLKFYVLPGKPFAPPAEGTLHALQREAFRPLVEWADDVNAAVAIIKARDEDHIALNSVDESAVLSPAQYEFLQSRVSLESVRGHLDDLKAKFYPYDPLTKSWNPGATALEKWMLSCRLVWQSKYPGSKLEETHNLQYVGGEVKGLAENASGNLTFPYPGDEAVNADVMIVNRDLWTSLTELSPQEIEEIKGPKSDLWEKQYEGSWDVTPPDTVPPPPHKREWQVPRPLVGGAGIGGKEILHMRIESGAGLMDIPPSLHKSQREFYEALSSDSKMVFFGCPVTGIHRILERESPYGKVPSYVSDRLPSVFVTICSSCGSTDIDVEVESITPPGGIELPCINRVSCRSCQHTETVRGIKLPSPEPKNRDDQSQSPHHRPEAAQSES